MAKIFANVKYHLPYDVADEEVHRIMRTLKDHGAAGHWNAIKADVIFVKTDNPKLSMTVEPRIPHHDLETCIKAGFELSDIYTHLGRRVDPARDKRADQRKRVVQVRWIDGCIQQGKQLPYEPWEIRVDNTSRTPAPNVKSPADRTAASPLPTHSHFGLRQDAPCQTVGRSQPAPPDTPTSNFTFKPPTAPWPFTPNRTPSGSPEPVEVEKEKATTDNDTVEDRPTPSPSLANTPAVPDDHARSIAFSTEVKSDDVTGGIAIERKGDSAATTTSPALATSVTTPASTTAPAQDTALRGGVISKPTSSIKLNPDGVFARGLLMPWTFHLIDSEKHKLALIAITQVGGGVISSIEQASIIVIPEHNLRVANSASLRRLVEQVQIGRAVVSIDWVEQCFAEDRLVGLAPFMIALGDAPARVAESQ